MSDVAAPPPESDLVFICGALRSGTTLLRLMIDGHPRLSNPGEMDFLFETPLRNGAPDMAAYARELAFNRVFRSRGLNLNPTFGYEDQVRDFIRQLRAPGKRLSINVHRHFDRIPAIFPDARYVHLLRDPRDVARSAIGMGWAGNVYFGVDHWVDSERSFERLAGMVDSKVTHRMMNEDLVRRPEDELRRLCAFLGVGYDPAMLDYPARTTYGPPDPALAEQWRRALSPRAIGLIEGKVGEMLAARGYPASGHPVLSPSGLEKAALRQSNRLGRWRFSARRNGVALTVLDLVSRRLPFSGLKSLVRRRLSARESEFLK